MSDAKLRFPLDVAFRVAKRISAALAPACEWVCIAGSVRREKPTVGDIEVLYIPRFRNVVVDLWGQTESVSLVDDLLDGGLKAQLVRRENALGRETYGRKIKLMRDVETGIPVDLFATTEASKFNYLVCRTGPAENNIRICVEAERRGWKWEPYSPGFVRRDRSRRSERMDSERAVFQFVGLPYFDPPQRT